MTSMMPGAGAQTYIAGGFENSTKRPYNPVPGSIINVVPADDVVNLQNRGWLVIPGNGTTSQRPAPQNISTGTMFVDSSLDKTVIWTGENWRDVVTGAIA